VEVLAVDLVVAAGTTAADLVEDLTAVGFHTAAGLAEGTVMLVGVFMDTATGMVIGTAGTGGFGRAGGGAVRTGGLTMILTTTTGIRGRMIMATTRRYIIPAVLWRRIRNMMAAAI
jgi:hypothetical protein